MAQDDQMPVNPGEAIVAEARRMHAENDDSPEAERWEAERAEDAEEIGDYSAAGVPTDGDLAPGEGEQHFT